MCIRDRINYLNIEPGVPPVQTNRRGVEQDHRTVKKRIRRMRGFKSFVSASATLEGIAVANMIRKDPLTPGLGTFAQFAALAE